MRRHHTTQEKEGKKNGRNAKARLDKSKLDETTPHNTRERRKKKIP